MEENDGPCRLLDNYSPNNVVLIDGKTRFARTLDSTDAESAWYLKDTRLVAAPNGREYSRTGITRITGGNVGCMGVSGMVGGDSLDTARVNAQFFWATNVAVAACTGRSR
ncbi:hypothetical protein HZH68_003128 [Vespula germanica]|uniref:Uncharacterized protein n=1 Tax=Vespula germanica TaxID=30212 RepID=A0A834NNP3_VESGE|nr:hypothetical protein HZH68_003128 [Vespula germanica]